MPILIIVALAGLAVWLMPKVVIGYKQGVPFNLSVASIGDFGCVLETNAAASYGRMQEMASLDGVTIKVKGPNSAFRTHDQQAEMLDERPAFAAQVDHSPHQLGTACDFDLTPRGALNWLQENAGDYGWHPLPGAGAAKEPWHWDYVASTDFNAGGSNV